MSPIINYENKTVVVTGAATGVGAALIDKLRAAQASHIIGLDIKPCAGVDDYIPTDLSDPSAIEQAVRRLPDRVDVLVNNAGVAATQPLPVVIGVNVLAPRALITALQNRMPAGSAVVNTASTAGGGFNDHITEIREFLDLDGWSEALAWVAAHPELTQNAYGFSKECVQVLTLVYSAPLALRGIRLNSVCPGLIDTPLITDFQASMGEPILNWMVSQSGGRKARPSEVADALAFLGSDAASYISGTNLLVDNGFTAAITTNQIDYSQLPALDGLTNA